MVVAQVDVEGAALHLHLETEHQAFATHQFEQLGVVADELFEPCAQALALFGDFAEEGVIGDRFHHRSPCRHGERVAAVGGAMRAEGHAARGLLGGDACAEREAATDPLGGGEDVGLDPVMLVSIELARACDAALHLIEHQHQIELVSQLAQALHEFDRRRTNPALALNRLDEEARRVRPYQRLGRFQIVERRILEPGEQRREAVVHFFLIGGRDGRHRPPVKGVVEGDQFETVLVAPFGILMIGARGLDRRLDRLCARIGEEHRVAEGLVDQPLRQLLALRAAIEVRHMHQRRRLLLDRADQPFMRMAEQVDRNAAGEIEVAGAVLADQMAVLAAHRPDSAARIDGHERGNRHKQHPEIEKVGGLKRKWRP